MKKRITAWFIASVFSWVSVPALADANIEKESHCKQMADAYRVAYPLSEQLTPKEIIKRIQQQFPKITYSENTHVVHSALVDLKETKLQEAKAEKERAEKEAAEREKAEQEAAEKIEQALNNNDDLLKINKKEVANETISVEKDSESNAPKMIIEEKKEEISEEKANPIDAKAQEIFEHCMKEDRGFFSFF